MTLYKHSTYKGHNYKGDNFLVETDWLADNLQNSDLRLYDCAALPARNPDEQLRKKYPLKPLSGRALYEEKHIPGAGYLDVPGELSDQVSEIPLMMPPLSQLVDVFRRAGISNNSQVVLYSSTHPMWATRVWWILKAVGFDHAVILNGGIDEWIAEGRPVSNEPSSYSSGHFAATRQDGLFVDKDHVRKALDDDETLLIHALTPSVYDGSNDELIFGRRGRIPGSVNIPSGLLYDPDTGKVSTS